MAQATVRELEGSVSRLQRHVDFHSQQLAGIGGVLTDEERAEVEDIGNLRIQIFMLRDDLDRLTCAVREFMKWEPWLLRVYRWWYGAVTPE